MIKRLLIAALCTPFLSAAQNNSIAAKDTALYPPYTWQEHWFDHRQEVKRVYFNDNIAVYFDDDVDRNKAQWLYGFVDSTWTYTKKVYGYFGYTDTTNRLFAVFHTDKYGGGHPGTYLRPRHDFRNIIDLGTGKNGWTTINGWEKNATVHEVAHIVEGAYNGIIESPAFPVWGDSKWAEIFVYDVYKGINREADAIAVFKDCIDGKDNFPRKNTYWFRNWFFPIYEQHKKAETLNHFFLLLAKHFPKKMSGHLPEYTRRMNLGEFIHYWSGAAGVDLSYRAQLAFGTKDNRGNEWAAQLDKAKKDFPGITYKTDPEFGIDITSSSLVKTAVGTGNKNTAEAAAIADVDIQTIFETDYKKGMWIEQEFSTPQVINAYLITSGNEGKNDPQSWVIKGSNNRKSWDELDIQVDSSFQYRNELKVVDFPNAKEYKYYRIFINESATDKVQIGEWRLLKK